MMRVRNGPIDIIMLTHDRLEHLAATVDALEARTPEPYRLTIVDNASAPEVRTWLGENRQRFHRLILRPTSTCRPSCMASPPP
jgi:GT2 family glycosyltransferase